MTPHACVICARDLAEGHACVACQTRLDHTLIEILDLYATLPDLLEPGRGAGQRVSGSREAPLPLRLDPLDLSLPARSLETISDEHHDQVGYVPVATELATWVGEWRESGAPGDQLPTPDVASLVSWLRVRLDWACTGHPAVDEFEAAIRDLAYRLRAVHGLTRARPDLIYVPCRECDQMTLYRNPGDDRVRCSDEDCRLVLWPEEYERWVGLMAQAVG